MDDAPNQKNGSEGGVEACQRRCHWYGAQEAPEPSQHITTGVNSLPTSHRPLCGYKTTIAVCSHANLRTKLPWHGLAWPGLAHKEDRKRIYFSLDSTERRMRRRRATPFFPIALHLAAFSVGCKESSAHSMTLLPTWPLLCCRHPCQICLQHCLGHDQECRSPNNSRIGSLLILWNALTAKRNYQYDSERWQMHL